MGRQKDNKKEKELRGTVRKDREQVSEAITGKPITDPRYCLGVSGYKELSGRAKGLYRQKCKELICGAGLYTTDLHQIILYASSYDQYWEYQKAVKEHGPVLTGTNKFGDSVLLPNPAVKMSRDALKDVMAIAARFGFSPVDRAKLKMEPKDEHDELAEFMDQFGGK